MTVAPLGVGALFTCVCYVLCKGGPRREYSDEWLMKTSDRSLNVRNLGEKYAFDVVDEPSPGYFLMKEARVGPRQVDTAVKRKDNMVAEPKIEFMKQLRYLDRHPRGTVPKQPVFPRGRVRRQTAAFTVSDSQWADMWHVREDQSPSMRVYDVWTLGYTGAGVHTSILDDGVEPAHIDLVANYEATYSYDYLGDQTNVEHTGTDYHGTWCAGIVAATKNNYCVLGLAYESTFSAVKIFDATLGLTDYGESLALTHQLSQTDIYSNSWGPSDDGATLNGPGELAAQGLKRGVTQGRGGKGAIYTWASGNGGSDDDCNCDGFSNSIYTVSVAAVDINQGIASYSESCSSLLVSTYAGIATTNISNGCVSIFHGTSAACPVAAAIIALTLEASPGLTWRDVQHLIVETASRDGLLNPDWQTNGAGKQVSHVYGFGLMDASAMVERSKTWSSVSSQLTCESGVISVNSYSYNGAAINSDVFSDGCGILNLEHVEAWLSFDSTYRGTIEITLTSPNGTASKLLHGRPNDLNSGTTDWTFMTVMTWGEDPSGQWTLLLETTNSSTGTADSADSDSKTGAIVGGVIGGVVGVGLLIALVAYFYISKVSSTVNPAP